MFGIRSSGKDGRAAFARPLGFGQKVLQVERFPPVYPRDLLQTTVTDQLRSNYFPPPNFKSKKMCGAPRKLGVERGTSARKPDPLLCLKVARKMICVRNHMPKVISC